MEQKTSDAPENPAGPSTRELVLQHVLASNAKCFSFNEAKGIYEETTPEQVVANVRAYMKEHNLK